MPYDHTVDGSDTSGYGSFSHYLQGFIHPRWCRISSINSMIYRVYLQYMHILDTIPSFPIPEVYLVRASFFIKKAKNTNRRDTIWIRECVLTVSLMSTSSMMVFAFIYN